MTGKIHFMFAWIVLLLCIFGRYFNGSAKAAELRPETINAWQQYVGSVERSMQSELASTNGFLSLDFQSKQDAARDRQELLGGGILIQRIEPGKIDGKNIPVPNGTIHHWRGTIFIPGVNLNYLLLRIENPDLEKCKQEDVLESRVLEKGPQAIKVYLRLQRSRIVTVVYDTEHLIKIQRYSGEMASSSSIATRIAELEKSKGKWDVAKPEGKDRGFLWRMNSYWRYQQVPGGVIVECESMTLSRSIPALLAAIANPIIKSIARESMQRTLQSFRERMVQGKKAPAMSGGMDLADSRALN